MLLEDRLRTRFDFTFHRWGGAIMGRGRPIGALRMSPRPPPVARGAKEPAMDATEQLQETLDYLLAGARGALEQGQSFVPFGAATRHDGERAHVQLEADGTGLSAQDAIGLLAGGLKRDAAQYAVAGLAYDGEIRTETGSVRAVCMHIETANEALEAFVPYVRDPTQGLTVHRPVVRATEASIFAR